MRTEAKNEDVPLDAEADARLDALAALLRKPRGVIAGELLSDLLRDPEFWANIHDPAGLLH